MEKENNVELSTFAKIKAIRTLLLNKIGQTLAYKNWSDEFKISEINEIPTIVKEWEKNDGSFSINPNDLSSEQMDELHFSKWSDESPLRLIPLWLFPFLCDEFDCESIDGSKHTKLSELDNDQRFGYIAYGVVPKP
jgi:hypothetical protein